MYSFELEDDNGIALYQPHARQSVDNLSYQLAHDHAQYGGIREEHIGLSHDTITQSADLALKGAGHNVPKRALILGAGSCADIPLSYLAEAFDETTLVDVNVGQTVRAVQALPSNLQDKVEVVAEDITGVVDEAVAWEGVDEAGPNTFLSRVARIFNGIDPASKTPSFGTNYDFVSSHLLHDQLLGGIENIVRDTAGGQYGGMFARTALAYHVGYNQAADALDGRLRQAHLDMLARTVTATGVIHFAGTYDFRCTVTLRGETNGPPLKLPDERFTLISEPKMWNWPITHIRVCSVEAYALRAHPPQ